VFAFEYLLEKNLFCGDEKARFSLRKGGGKAMERTSILGPSAGNGNSVQGSIAPLSARVFKALLFTR